MELHVKKDLANQWVSLNCHKRALKASHKYEVVEKEPIQMSGIK